MIFVKSNFLVLLTCLSVLARSQCSTIGPLTAGSVSNNATVGTIGWGSLLNTQLSDNSYSSAGTTLGVLSSAFSNYIVFKNFGFTVPSGASICGIEVTREASASGLLVGSSIRDNDIRIVKNNVIGGINHAAPGNWPGTDATTTVGGIADDWGLAWTAGDINSSDFGVAISVRLGSGLASLFLSANIDRVSITVYYNLILPVRLQSFTAKAAGNKVQLNWTTASESNNQYFLVQHSEPSMQWTTIDTVNGAGSSNEKKHYQLMDEHPYAINYYRLVQTDIDGHSSYSSVVTVSIEKQRDAISIYPNPAKQQLRQDFRC